MLISCAVKPPTATPSPASLAPYRDAGCDAVHLAWSRLEPSEILPWLQSANLHLSGVDVGTFDAAAKADVTATITRIQTRMEWARAVGSTNICLGTGERRGQPWTILSEGIQEILPAANDHGLDVHVLNARDTTIEQIEDLRRLFADIRHPRLRLALDIGAFHASAVNPRDALGEFADLVGCIRVSDRIGQRPVPLGQGKVNLQRIIHQAAKCRYRGWFVLDPCENRDSGTTASPADAVAYLRKLG
ncbi:MAG: TIM barrel protein [Phycisphaerae bacterium]|nr:TIM barrel protein [Phycisphaerae bacterium]